MMTSTILVAVVGVKFAMGVVPFWTPDQFSQYRCRSLSFSVNDACTRLVPILGMLCGNAIGGIMVSQSYVLKELELVILSLWHSLSTSLN
jgi:hypothetical protein